MFSLAAGFFMGGGGLSGAGLLWWSATAASPPEEEDKQQRRRRKKEAVLAAREEAEGAVCSGLVRRWVWWPWWPHWQWAEAEVRRGLLLLRAASAGREALSSSGGGAFASGARCTAVPLAGAEATTKRPSGGDGDDHWLTRCYGIELKTAAGEKEQLRLPTAEERAKWAAALRSERERWTAHRRRVVEVALPATWEAPLEAPQIVPLDKGCAEFKRVEKLALSQQYHPAGGRPPYVKGRLKVTGVSRVQQPHVWEQYCMRRAILAAENEGEPTERLLWHGTPVPHVIIKEGFDPRVCNLQGMFGAGVYFADKSTKSVRYAGANKPGDMGTLLLCRVSLGRPMLKWLPQPSIRRPPDPYPLFNWEHFQLWRNGGKFHSVFASSESAFSSLLMNEYIVYHSNQGYPEYVVNFELM